MEKMKNAIISFIIGFLIISLSGISAINIEKINGNNISQYPEENKISKKTYSHSVLVGVATSQNCYPCDYMNSFIYSLYNNETHDFHYVDMIIYDKNGNILNSWADYWAERHNILKQPTLIFDGGYKKHIGYKNLENIPAYIDECGSRDVWDLNAEMSVLWVGDATIQIDINIENHENEEYKFYLRTFVTEKNSRYRTYFNNIYHYGFLDFAIFGNPESIPAGGTYSITEIWNGNEHEDGNGNDFGDINKNNIKIITGIYRGNTPSHYIDQTIAATPIEGEMPNKPIRPSGPNIGKIGIEYNFSTSTTDPQGEKVYYLFDWGDGEDSGWIGPVESGTSVQSGHIWRTSRSFDVKVKAKDASGYESVWSDSSKIRIPREKAISLTLFLRIKDIYKLVQNYIPNYLDFANLFFC